MKSVFDGIISRFNRAKEGISELEDRSVETAQAEMQRGKRKRKTTHKTSNDYGTISKGIYIIGIPERENKRENGEDEIFEVISSTFQN